MNQMIMSKSEKTIDSVSSNVRRSTEIVDSVYRQVTQLIDDRDEILKGLQSRQSNDSVSSNVHKSVTKIVDSVFRHVTQIVEDREKDPASKTAAHIVSSIFRHVTQVIEDREEDSASKTAISIVSSVYRHVIQVIEDREDSSPESVKNYVSEIVNNVLDEALMQIEEESSKLYPKTKEAIESRPSVFHMADSLICRIFSEAQRRADQIKLLGVERFAKYSSLEDFKVKDGLEIVARCISTWKFNPHWYFKVIYNGRSISDTYSYFYTVRWSAPSLSYPVSQVSADIYFIIEVSPMTPPPIYIKVCFRMETDCSERCALRTPFQEKWLHTVVKRKLKAFQMFTF